MSLLEQKEAIKELRTHYKDSRLIPFIGAGFSMPLGLPSWNSLIESIAPKLDFEPDLFKLHGSNIQLAEYVNLVNRREWKRFIKQMIVDFDSKSAVEKRKISEPHKTLANLEWKTIYTTNYDSHIEGAISDAGKPVVALASLEDFLEKRDPNACEVIKFHGSLENQETLILTESQYFTRMELESPVDQRLRSDILSNSFMFIGYDFQDPNIRFIWYKIHKLRRAERDEDYASLRPSYFITFGVNPVQPILLDRWNINVILLDPQDREKALAEFLSKIGN